MIHHRYDSIDDYDDHKQNRASWGERKQKEQQDDLEVKRTEEQGIEGDRFLQGEQK